ncbi:MAG: ATPase, T2SS/T4P/T4SS family [Desulfobacteria bacterium]
MSTTVKTEKAKIGSVLVSEGYITQAQLDETLSKQKETREYLPLGQLCVQLGYLSETELSRILKAHKYKVYLGELLVNMSLITPSQLDQALEQQKTSGKKIGEVLCEAGLIKEEQLVQALSTQLGIPKIIPDINLIDTNFAVQVNEAFLRRVEAVPAFKEDETATVIMADPLSESTIHDLERLFGCQIEPAVATRTAINELLDKLFKKIEYPDGAVADDDQTKDLVIGDVDDAHDEAENVVNIVNYIISTAIAEGASDIHIETLSATLRIRYRVDGILLHKTDLPKALSPQVISRIKVLCSLDIAEKRRHQDGRLEARIHGEEIDLRISVYSSVHGESVVIRVLQRTTTMIDLEKLGFAPGPMANYRSMLDYPSGLILVTGPTGCGKTTTLYASLTYLNKYDKKIITVEDPVEYTIDGVVQGKIERKLDVTYSDFLKAMMRQDPDVIMVGEIRDQVAAEATIQAALTGHKVFTTFHTDDTTGALLRLMDMGIDTFLISSTVVSVVSQRLIRTICPHCKEPYVPDKKEFEAFNVKDVDASRYSFCRTQGCAQCNNTGYKGRTGIQEILVVNEAIRDAILSRKTSGQIRNIARQSTKMVSMLEDGFYKATKGITTLEEVLRVVYHNEADVQTPRTAEQIVAILEGSDKGDRVHLPGGVTDMPPPTE